MTDPPRTKPELVKLIQERWDALQELVGPLSPGDMEKPLGDGWSTKVHLGHLAAWEQSLMALLRRQDRAAAMGLSAEVWAGHDTDAMNRVIAERSQSQSLEAVVDQSNATHGELMALLDSLSQDDLEKPYSDYQPADLPHNAKPVGGWVHGNTWDHYDEHIGWLEAGLKA